MRVLIVNYDFPPALSGVRRVVKFAKYLPEFGFEPIVLAAEPSRRAPLDLEALAEVEAEGYPVIRTASLDPQYLAGRLLPGRRPESRPLMRKERSRTGDRIGRPPAGLAGLPAEAPAPAPLPKPPGQFSKAIASFTRRALVPDDRIGWLPFATRAAERIVRSEPVPFVLTSSYPNTSHLVGLHLKKRFRIRWVADFRDGWTQNPYFADGLTPFHARLNRQLEARVAREADALIAVSKPIAEHLATLTDPEKVVIIPNGFDPDDYEGIEPLEFDKFTLAYTGTLFMQRSPAAFFHALRALFDEYPRLAAFFQVIFRTRFQPEHEALIRELNLGGVVRNWGLGTHREALQLQVSAHALLVLEGEGPNAEIMLTQKVFEYLAAVKPILAVTPPGALSDLVRRTRTGVVVPPDDAARIKEQLLDLFNDQVRFRPDGELIARFTRRELTRDLASLLWELRQAPGFSSTAT